VPFNKKVRVSVRLTSSVNVWSLHEVVDGSVDGVLDRSIDGSLVGRLVGNDVVTQEYLIASVPRLS